MSSGRFVSSDRVNKPISQALDEVRAMLEIQHPLLDVLDADAVLARIDQATAADAAVEFVDGLPRLLELLVMDDLGSIRPWEITRRFPDQGWLDWPPSLRTGVATVFDQWWLTVLNAHPSRPPVGEVLATLVALELPLSRWLHPLLRSFDGAGARHLADIVMGQLEGDGWTDREDERQQVLAWCRTEPVLMGITLVGAVHLDDGLLGELLDELL